MNRVNSRNDDSTINIVLVIIIIFLTLGSKNYYYYYYSRHVKLSLCGESLKCKTVKRWMTEDADVFPQLVVGPVFSIYKFSYVCSVNVDLTDSVCTYQFLVLTLRHHAWNDDDDAADDDDNDVIKTGHKAMPMLCPWHTYQKSLPKTNTRKAVHVSKASNMQFGTEFFWWYQFSARVFGTDFWYVCHGHYSVATKFWRNMSTHSWLSLTLTHISPLLLFG